MFPLPLLTPTPFSNPFFRLRSFPLPLPIPLSATRGMDRRRGAFSGGSDAQAGLGGVGRDRRLGKGDSLCPSTSAVFVNVYHIYSVLCPRHLSPKRDCGPQKGWDPIEC